jgi:hypothetical protein
MRLAPGFSLLALTLAVGVSSAQTATPPAPAAPSPAPAATGDARAAPAAPGAPAAEGEKKPPPQAGGYSWTDKKPARARRWVKRTRRVKFDPKAPFATYPGFRMLAGGKSSVWVYVSKKVSVDVRRAAGRVAFVLSGAQVASFNNTHPLVTHYFNTPLSRAWLRPDKGGAELVLELRENVTPTHRVVDGPAGTMILQIELPRASRTYVAQPVQSRDATKGQILVPAKPRRRQ